LVFAESLARKEPYPKQKQEKIFKKALLE